MHESLKVYLKDSFVGWLSHETVGDEYSFEYNKDYLANPVEGALSFALPLTGWTGLSASMSHFPCDFGVERNERRTKHETGISEAQDL